MTNDLPLTLDSDAFNGFKNDISMMIQQTLSRMERKESEEASLTIKLGVTLKKGYVRDYAIVTHEAQREIIKPEFEHKITSTIQYKSEKSGIFCSDGEMIFDKSKGYYALRSIPNDQTSLYDADYSEGDDEDNDSDSAVIEFNLDNASAPSHAPSI